MDTHNCFSIHLLMDIWIVSILAITDKTAMKGCVEVFVWTYVFISLG